MHEIFEADQGDHIAVICFNGFIHTIDHATGQDIQPHLISIRTTKERFAEIDLERIDKPQTTLGKPSVSEETMLPLAHQNTMLP